jgi:signal transduction histidine kinase
MPLRYVITAFVLFSATISQAQTKTIDSLKKVISSESNSAKKLSAVFLLCEQRQSLPDDTLARYANFAKQMALKTAEKNNIVLADFYISSSLVKRERFDSALAITEQNLAHLDYSNNKDAYLKFSIQKGQIFIKSERYREALGHFYKLLNEAESVHDELIQANITTNIGWVNLEMGQYKEALKWFYNALAFEKNPELSDYLGVIYSNMAATYNELGQNDSAMVYIKRSIAANRKSGKNLSFLANALAIEADIFIDTKRKSLAEAPLNEALKIREQIGEPFYIVSDMMQLALLYASNNEADKGIALCKQGIAMANQFGISAKLPILYDALAKNYLAAGMYKDYAATLNNIISLRDSLYQKNSAEALAELQAKYDLQKKENTIIQQKLDLAKKNALFYGSLALTAFTLAIAFIVLRNYRRKQKLRIRNMLEKEKQLAAEAVIKAEENERKRISADLHDNLGVYAASIASNIDHILANHKAPDNLFIFEELRNNSQEIVSQLNDTIWALKKDALSLTAISDRLKLFILRIESSYPNVKIDVVEKIDEDHLLPPSQAFHLFQIMKEGINNALKHSGCKQIFVTIESNAGSQWKVNIEDDGAGINYEGKNTGGGNGLENMRNRSKESGWKIQWQSNQPGGTSVMIQPV